MGYVLNINLIWVRFREREFSPTYRLNPSCAHGYPPVFLANLADPEAWHMRKMLFNDCLNNRA
jgi:hypothetical protein